MQPLASSQMRELALQSAYWLAALGNNRCQTMPNPSSITLKQCKSKSDDAARWAVEVTPYNEQPTIKSTHLSQAAAEKSAYSRWTREMWPDTPFGLVQQIVDVDKARIYAETSASRRMRHHQLLSKAGGPYRAYDVVKPGSGVIMTVAVVELPLSSKAPRS